MMNIEIILMGMRQLRALPQWHPNAPRTIGP